MIKSMTGFGKGEAALRNKKITVEIRSLNSKQLDLALRLPAVYRQSEYEIRNLVTRLLQRGKVDVFVNVESQVVETSAHINREAFAAYAAQLREAARSAGLTTDTPEWDAAATHTLMRLPDVVATEAETISDEEHDALLAATEAAAAQLNAFRTQEGATLIADLLRRVDLIEQYKNEVVPFERDEVRFAQPKVRTYDAGEAAGLPDRPEFTGVPAAVAAPVSRPAPGDELLSSRFGLRGCRVEPFPPASKRD